MICYNFTTGLALTQFDVFWLNLIPEIPVEMGAGSKFVGHSDKTVPDILRCETGICIESPENMTKRPSKPNVSEGLYHQ